VCAALAFEGCFMTVLYAARSSRDLDNNADFRQINFRSIVCSGKPSRREDRQARIGYLRVRAPMCGLHLAATIDKWFSVIVVAVARLRRCPDCSVGNLSAIAGLPAPHRPAQVAESLLKTGVERAWEEQEERVHVRHTHARMHGCRT
jgi:hypothetical protein